MTASAAGVRQGPDETAAPALYACTLRHVRQGPVRNDFTYRTWLWFVDLDELPRLPWFLRQLGRLRARDHAGDPRASLRANVDAFLAEHGKGYEVMVRALTCKASH